MSKKGDVTNNKKMSGHYPSTDKRIAQLEERVKKLEEAQRLALSKLGILRDPYISQSRKNQAMNDALQVLVGYYEPISSRY